MDFVADCPPDIAKELSERLLKSGCEYKVLRPRQLAGIELVTSIILPVTLTSIQIVAQILIERAKSEQKEVKIYLDGKQFVPTPEAIDEIKKKLG